MNIGPQGDARFEDGYREKQRRRKTLSLDTQLLLDLICGQPVHFVDSLPNDADCTRVWFDNEVGCFKLSVCSMAFDPVDGFQIPPSVLGSCFQVRHVPMTGGRVLRRIQAGKLQDLELILTDFKSAIDAAGEAVDKLLDADGDVKRVNPELDVISLLQSALSRGQEWLESVSEEETKK